MIATTLFKTVLALILLSLPQVLAPTLAHAACTDGGGYPWATGDCLYVEDLNAAIAGANPVINAPQQAGKAIIGFTAGVPVFGPVGSLTTVPAPTATTLGGVTSFAAPAGSFLTGVTTAGGYTTGTPTLLSFTPITSNFVTGFAAGVPSVAQPSFSDLSGTATASQLQVTSANATPFTDNGAFIKFQQGTVANDSLFGLPQYNAFEARLEVPVGTTVQNAAAVGAYVVNRTPSLGESGNAVAYMAITNAVANGSATWGLNTVNNTTDPAGTGKVLAGYEADFNMASPNDRVRGIGVYGATGVALTSDTRDGIVVGQLSVTQPGLATWLRGFVCDPAAITQYGVCLDIQPEAITGNSVGGPSINWWYRDTVGATHFISAHALGDGTLAFDSDTEPTASIGFFIKTTFHQPVEMPSLTTASPGGPGKLVCINDATGFLYRATGTSC